MKCFFLLFFLGCGSVPVKELDPAVYYKRSLRLRINGSAYTYGTQVVDFDTSYKIETKSPSSGDVIMLKTCHRETLSEDEGRRFKFNYLPALGLEIGNLINCPLSISHMNHKGRHAWGMVVFRDEDLTRKLVAVSKCNGNTSASFDKTVCQSKNGLEQEISFKEEVEFSEGCTVFSLQTTDKKTFRYDMPNRLKQCLFYGKSGTHLLIAIGYEQVLLQQK